MRACGPAGRGLGEHPGRRAGRVQVHDAARDRRPEPERGQRAAVRDRPVVAGVDEHHGVVGRGLVQLAARRVAALPQRELLVRADAEPAAGRRCPGRGADPGQERRDVGHRRPRQVDADARPAPRARSGCGRRRSRGRPCGRRRRAAPSAARAGRAGPRCCPRPRSGSRRWRGPRPPAGRVHRQHPRVVDQPVHRPSSPAARARAARAGGPGADVASARWQGTPGQAGAAVGRAQGAVRPICRCSGSSARPIHWRCSWLATEPGAPGSGRREARAVTGRSRRCGTLAEGQWSEGCRAAGSRSRTRCSARRRSSPSCCRGTA